MNSTPKLTKRSYSFSATARRWQPAAKAFLAPQRPHVRQPMPPRAK